MAPRNTPDVLADLATTASELADLLPKVEALYEQRARLFHEGRRMEPKATHVAMAKAAGVSETSVTNALAKPDPGPAKPKRRRT